MSISNLDRVGEVKYGGFQFPAPLNITQFRCTPVYDSSGRTIKYREFDIAIMCILTAEDINIISGESVTLDQQTAALRKILMTEGRTFICKGQGLGDFEVNYSNVLDFGPKPYAYDLKPIGSCNAHRLTWAVKFTIVDCPSRYLGNDGSNLQTTEAPVGTFTELSFSISHNVRENGRVSRTITGTIEGIVRRTGEMTSDVIGTADSYINALRFPKPGGFTRTIERSVSPDGRSLRFTIRDNEIESDNPFPEKCLRISMHHRISGSITASARWNVNFSGTVTLPPGVHKSWAFVAFWQLVNARIQKLKVQGVQAVIITNLTIDNNIFGDDVGFSCAITCYLTKSDLFNLIDKTDIFKPTFEHGWSWSKWHSSVDPIVFPNNFGWRGVHTGDAAFKIVNACKTTNQELIDNTQGTSTAGNPWFTNECPPNGVWERCDVTWDIVADIDTIAVQGIGSATPSTNMGMNGLSITCGGGTGVQSYSRGSGNRYVILRGYMVRLGKPIASGDIPEMSGGTSFGTPFVSNGCVGVTPLGCPIYHCSFAKAYLLLSGSASVTVNNMPPGFSATMGTIR